MDTTTWQPRLALMGGGDTEKLHRAALTVLAETGLNVHHEEMRELLAANGARTGEAPRVYLPEGMVEGALATARREVVIYDRTSQPAMRLTPHRIYFGTGSDLLYTRDPVTAQRRPSTLDDAGRAARLCDALEEIDFLMSFAMPAGVPGEDVEPQQYYSLLSNSTKPVIMTLCSGAGAMERMHEMACVVAGGDAAFRQRPNYILYSQFVSPLQHDRQAIERLVFCADNEVPLIYIPTIMPGVSGPITLAGSLALAVAESLAGLVMHQLRSPGAPFVFGGCVGPMDMRTMLFPYGGPEWRINDLVMAEMSRHYGLPVFGTGGATDGKVVDTQAGAEASTSLLAAALAGTNLIHDVGYLESGLTGSLESIVLGADMIRWTRQYVAGLQVSEETLALDLTRDVGPGGHFLDQPHTLEHFRDSLAPPYVLDRDGYDQWKASGSREYGERARNFARELVDGHLPEPLDGNRDTRLRELARLPS